MRHQNKSKATTPTIKFKYLIYGAFQLKSFLNKYLARYYQTITVAAVCKSLRIPLMPLVGCSKCNEKNKLKTALCTIPMLPFASGN